MPARSKPRSARSQSICPYCGQQVITSGLKSHIRQSPYCQQEFKKRTDSESEIDSLSRPHNDPNPDLFTGGGFEYPNPLLSSTSDDVLENSVLAEEPPSKRARVEEVDDDEYDAGGLPRRPFVDYTARTSVKTKGKGNTLFEKIRIEQEAKGSGNRWAPFRDEEEWGLAHFLMTQGLTQSAVDKYLKLPIVSTNI